jgi:hypothetical protein
MIKKIRCVRPHLLEDINSISNHAREDGYLFGPKDVFAIGYMCGKYKLNRLLDNQEKVIEACREYDEKDDLALLDTIGETLIDLKVISNDKKIL